MPNLPQKVAYMYKCRDRIEQQRQKINRNSKTIHSQFFENRVFFQNRGGYWHIFNGIRQLFTEMYGALFRFIYFTPICLVGEKEKDLKGNDF